MRALLWIQKQSSILSSVCPGISDCIFSEKERENSTKENIKLGMFFNGKLIMYFSGFHLSIKNPSVQRRMSVFCLKASHFGPVIPFPAPTQTVSASKLALKTNTFYFHQVGSEENSLAWFEESRCPVGQCSHLNLLTT